jgi:hypothetical protein
MQNIVLADRVEFLPLCYYCSEHYPLSQVYFIHATFRKVALLPQHVSLYECQRQVSVQHKMGIMVMSLLSWTLPICLRYVETRDVSELDSVSAACAFMSHTGQCTMNERLSQIFRDPSPVSCPHLGWSVPEETRVSWPAWDSRLHRVSPLTLGVSVSCFDVWNYGRTFARVVRNECYAVGGHPTSPVFSCVVVHVCRTNLWDASYAGVI